MERLKVLQNKRGIIAKANAGSLELDDDTWEFITNNNVFEVYDYILSKFQSIIPYSLNSPDVGHKFYRHVLNYINSFPETKKFELVYGSMIQIENEALLLKVSEIMSELLLLDLDRIKNILLIDNFQKSKRSTTLITLDKPFYNTEDIEKLKSISESIRTIFLEKGRRSLKKQLLSSKEKEIWTCECGKTNDIDVFCTGCKKDIYGFTANEVSPPKALRILEQKISLISEYIK